MASASPVTPAQVADTIPSSTGSICSKLQSLWSLANLMSTWFSWWENSDGTLSDSGKLFLAAASVPVGSMVDWPLDVAPEGWIVANGAIISRFAPYDQLFAAYGTKFGAGDGTTTFQLPDLRRKFSLGASGSNLAGSTGGSETLTVANMPAHTHGLNEEVISAVFGNPVATAGNSSPTVGGAFAGLNDSDGDLLETVGDGDAFLPPYFSVNKIIKL